MSFDAAKIEIRPLDELDFDAVLGIAEVLEEAPHWSREHYEEAIRADSPRPRIALVAVDLHAAEVVGFAIANLVAPEAELESIAVAERGQRCGIGRRLMSALIEELRRRDVRELLLEVRASNLPAIRFYESQNFKQNGVRPIYYVDSQEDAVLMSLNLR
jgi:ribosomal-protein-alanine acetyltransferase